MTPAPAVDGFASPAAFAAFLARRLAAAAIEMIAAIAVACIVFELAPAHPIRTLTHGLPVPASQLATLRHQLGLGEPAPERFWQLLENVARLRFGYSYQFQESAGTLIGQRIGPTLLLMGSSALLAAGTLVAVRRRRGRTRPMATASLVLWSAPGFWIGMILLVLLGVGVGGLPDVFPAGQMVSPQLSAGTVHLVLDVVWHLVLPSLTLALVLVAQSLTATRRATTFARVGAFVSATIAVEVVFSWPGLGDLAYQALQTPDAQLLEASFLALSAVTIAIRLGSEVVRPLVRPLLARGALARGAPAGEGGEDRPQLSWREHLQAVMRTSGGFTGVATLVLVVAWTLAAPLFVHPAQLNAARAGAPPLHGPTLADPLGTDGSGRPVLALVLWGGRSSLLITAIAGAIAVVLGTAVGLVAGCGRRLASRAAAAIVDWCQGPGSLALAISVAAIIGPGNVSITVAVALTSWAGSARLVASRPARGLIAAVAAGSAFALADALLGAATLSFLGLGSPFSVSWGAILNQAFVDGDIATGSWWAFVFPGAAILVVVLALRLIGRAAWRDPGALGARPAAVSPARSAPTSSG